MKDPTLNDLAVEALTELKQAEQAGGKYNDFGSILGVRDELELIERDLSAALRQASMRACRLRVKIDKWEKGEREVPTLR